MRRFCIFICALFFGAGLVNAQNDPVFDPSGKWYVSLQGGALYSINENHFTYRKNDKGYKLITPQVALGVGYDFSTTFGLRGTLGYAKNAGAGNYYQTAARGFYPYNFDSVNLFVDAILHINGLNVVKQAWQPKLYAGLGYAHSFRFRKPSGYGTPHDKTWAQPFHPWQEISDPSDGFGLRLGFISDYQLNSHLCVFADLCGEAYTDGFNGLHPRDEDQKDYEGSAGFPFDLRGIVSFGLSYKF